MFEALSDRFEGIFKKLRSRGLLTDKEIDELLEESQRYEDRAKGLLKQAVGQSAPEVNNGRWERFRQDRRNRGAVAHSANEPDAAYATAAVENMIGLTGSACSGAATPLSVRCTRSKSRQSPRCGARRSGSVGA